MTTSRLTFLGLGIALLRTAYPSVHAPAKYHASRTLPLTGHVSAFAWRNPHSFLYIDVDAGPYKGRVYVVEMSSAGVLASQGWTRARFRPGDEVDLTVLPSRTAGTA